MIASSLSRTPVLAPAVLLLGTALAPPAASQCEPWQLAIEPIQELPSYLELDIQGVPGTSGYLFVDFAPGSTTVPGVGTFDLAFTPAMLIIPMPPLPASGQFTVPCDLSCSVVPFDVPLYAQAATLGAGSPKACVTNSVSTLVVASPGCECISTGSIASGFNGTDVEAGSTVWFNAIVDLENAGGQPFSAAFTDVTISFVADSVPVTLTLPESFIEFSDDVAVADTSYDAVNDVWVTKVPTSYTGNVFLSGAPYAVGPAGLPGGVDDVTWSGDFQASATGISFQWKWAAAVYETFTGDLDAIGVKPIDGGDLNPYPNSDKAGTPENFKDFVTGGAMGGGGSNFTGSYSATKTLDCP